MLPSNVEFLQDYFPLLKRLISIENNMYLSEIVERSLRFNLYVAKSIFR